MLLIPAIDLKDGQCVRLKQGDMDQATIFSEDPAAMARKWVDLGARRLHLVDLNGAFAGKPKNLEAIEAILDEVGDEIPVQLGGGIRSLETIEHGAPQTEFMRYGDTVRIEMFDTAGKSIFGAIEQSVAPPDGAA